MVVILAGVTMNALFAWLVFTFLAAKNGRQIDPVTTVGRVIEELVPPGGEALRDDPARAADRRRSTAGRWRRGTTSERHRQRAGAGGPARRWTAAAPSTLPIHQDALEERLKAAQALQPFRPAGGRPGAAGQAGGAGGDPAGRHDRRDRRTSRSPSGTTCSRCCRRSAGTPLAMTVGRRRRPAHASRSRRRSRRSGPGRQAAAGRPDRRRGRRSTSAPSR